ncbi:MAG: TraM recognition domain-containing protein [Alphaproteobacteria bacterium]|nr:TraM recognition domain-containing protein [Alphaproteobacteria bacterium]
MSLKSKYEYKQEDILRDSRPLSVRILDGAKDSSTAAIVFCMATVSIYVNSFLALYSDLIFFIMLLYFLWLFTRPITLMFKLPKSANRKDPNYSRPDGTKGKSDGILYLGNSSDTGEEAWFNNTDARTHCLYLGTTGSGKTFGLKSFACNALCWASGYIYIDGKADTDLWSTLSAMARRFGRDDDLLIMNYMTGNVGGRVPSNTLNPFSSGSSSYLTNMIVSLMPDADGDNAMWKERAVSLISSIMPCLVWKRDNQNIPLSISIVRQYLTFKAVIKLSRDSSVPDHLRTSLRAYLNELPGYVDTVFDDEGNEKPMPPDAGAVDTSVPRQQHGYLSMQFTRSMSSLGDDYGFIFDTQAADIDMSDVVLNRRILVVLIPALEKSGDETANLGKIISSTLKGMMGATLGSTVEGDTATAIENKPTTSSTPFMAIFDEVGYYVAQGMAVMAAQARSLGFSLIFASQDLAAMEKRVKEEARSITANCNIKLFGKLEDPTQTKDFFEKTVGTALVTEVSSFARGQPGTLGRGYVDTQSAGIQLRARVTYDVLKGFTEGRAICSFGEIVNEIQVFNSDIGHAKAMRVHRFLPIPPPSEAALEGLQMVDGILRRFRNPKWNPKQVQMLPNTNIDALVRGIASAKKADIALLEYGIQAVAFVAAAHKTIKPEDALPPAERQETTTDIHPSPPVAEAEKAAAMELAKVGGPLSWSEVIGASDTVRKISTDTEPQQRTAPPVIPGEEEAAAQIKTPFSWGDVIGATPVVPDTTVADESEKPPVDLENIVDKDDPSKKE